MMTVVHEQRLQAQSSRAGYVGDCAQTRRFISKLDKEHQGFHKQEHIPPLSEDSPQNVILTRAKSVLTKQVCNSTSKVSSVVQVVDRNSATEPIPK